MARIFRRNLFAFDKQMTTNEDLHFVTQGSQSEDMYPNGHITYME